MILLIVWIILALLIGKLSEKRPLGFWPAVGISLVLSPLIAAIVALAYKGEKGENIEKVKHADIKPLPYDYSKLSDEQKKKITELESEFNYGSLSDQQFFAELNKIVK